MSEQRLTYTVEETAELIGVSLSATYKCIRRGELPCVHIGRRVLVPRRALESMLGSAPGADDQKRATEDSASR
jgi:excisionase family DNA binding protein